MKIRTSIRTLALIAVMPLGCSTAPPASTPAEAIAGDQSVHCLLPAQVRKLGNTVYPARRQLVFESETRCTLRGGEYTVYDRASAESSAEFYQGLAESGDAEAQYSLGLVYESLYNPPRYRDAAQWYQRAADQKHANALKNLSFLYERGLGVEQDQLLAVNLLRQSGGITDDLVMTSEMDAALSAAGVEVRRLTQALEQQNGETSSLRQALASANQNIIQQRQQLGGNRAELAQLRQQQSQLERQAQNQSNQPQATQTIAQVERVKTQASNKERMIAQQELIIASLSADLTAQQAQLKASEQKATLQERRLTEQLAAVRAEAGGDSEQVQQALAAKDAQIASLSSALDTAQASLSKQEAERRTLLSQLERKRVEIDAAQGSTAEMKSLLAALTEREATISEQTARIRGLQTQQQTASTTASEMRTLKNQLGELQQALTEQQLGYTALELELQAARSSAVSSDRSADSEMQRLLTQLADGNDTIATQKQRMAQLETDAANAERALTDLEASRSQAVSELDLVQAQLVAVEADLVRAQSNLTQLETSLKSSQMTENALRQENERLNQQIDIASGTGEARIEDLRAQLSRNNQELQAQAETISQLQRKIADGRVQLATVQQDRVQQLAMRSVPQPVFPKVPDIDLGLGKRYALIIGNDNYEYLNNLTTAVNGAKAVGDLLRTQYGFDTQVMLNASRREMIVAFSELRAKLEPEDQVFIYYAGHGERSNRDDAITYWLPVEAQEDEMSYAADGIKSTWITNEMRAMKARHVMIVADSCYAGAMVRPVRVAVPTRSIDERRLNWMNKRRSRTVLTSGGDRPVLDESVEGTHSVFTQALVDVLSENPGVIYGEALHAALVQLVRYNAEQLDFDQVPRFSEVADANHGNGQFVMKNIRG